MTHSGVICKQTFFGSVLSPKSPTTFPKHSVWQLTVPTECLQIIVKFQIFYFEQFDLPTEVKSAEGKVNIERFIFTDRFWIREVYTCQDGSKSCCINCTRNALTSRDSRAPRILTWNSSLMFLGCRKAPWYIFKKEFSGSRGMLFSPTSVNSSPSQNIHKKFYIMTKMRWRAKFWKKSVTVCVSTCDRIADHVAVSFWPVCTVHEQPKKRIYFRLFSEQSIDFWRICKPLTLTLYWLPLPGKWKRN
jgi:hypothetical protein